MKIQLPLFILTIATLVSFSTQSFGQMPNLRSAANFVVFTSVGAVNNTGVSNINGNIGTDNGDITGFEPPTTINGNIESSNTITNQCKADLQAAYDELFITTSTNTSHTPAFGSGETLSPGVYSIAAAGSVAGNLILDAEGNPDAVFIFKFGGALTTGASTTISLINNASACNIFWIAEGAISMAASTIMKGTLIANNGAVSMGADGSLEGRMMSTAGAASIYQVSVISSCALYVMPVKISSFEGSCNGKNVMLTWITETEKNNNYFTIDRSTDGINWQMAGTVPGGVNSSSQLTYTYMDNLPTKSDLFYRLKQTDFDGNYKYTKAIRIQECGNNTAGIISVFPNPTNSKFAIKYTGNPGEVKSVSIHNSRGQKMYMSNGLQTNFDLPGFVPGIYFIRIELDSNFVDIKTVVIK